MISVKEKIAYSIACFILTDVPPCSEEPIEQMYMRWKKKSNFILHHPENARYALRKFAELGYMTTRERESFAATVEYERNYLTRQFYDSRERSRNESKGISYEKKSGE